MSNFGWQRRAFLTLVGLAHRNSADGKPREVELAEAGIDPRTGGAISVTTKATLDGRDGVSRIKTYYWRMMPNGEQLSQKLFDIEFDQGESTIPTSGGRLKKTATQVPRAVWVLGRKLYDAADDGDLEEGELSNAKGAMHNLTRVMMAVGEVNRQLRDGKLADVAKIFEECNVRDAAGESFVINGQSPKGGFNFTTAKTHDVSANEDLTVPTLVARALTGFGVNTLDKHQQLRPKTLVQAGSASKGALFTTEARVKDGDSPKLFASIEPASLHETDPTQAIPCLTNVEWLSHGNGQCTLKVLNLLREKMQNVDHLTHMRMLGVTNRIVHDLRKSPPQYPPVIDYLIEYDLYHLMYELEPPPPLAEGGRLSMISVGGNNMEETADGFGEAIGGNSKVVYHEGLDKSGKVDRVGVIIDLGLHLSPKDEANISAAPDVIEHLKHCDDILITHRHLDHTDGMFAYIQHGYLKGKTVHCTPEVERSIRDKIASYPSIHIDDLPTFAPLVGEGWLHVKDKQGKTRLSVNYARNATPHSARTTPFFVHGHYEGKWLGSYLNHGDARFGRHNGDDYEGPEVDSDHLNKKFFAEPNQRFLKEMERLRKLNPKTTATFDPKIANRRATYFDMDTTSILKKGWAPTEAEVEDNLSEISDWFKDKGMLLAMISTNDNRYETALRMATRVHRDVTEFGANLQKTATTMNKLGVNDLRHEPIARNNIQAYLDQIFERRLVKKIEKHKESLETTSNEKTRRTLENKIERHEARLAMFQTLKTMPNANARYNKRAEMEADLAKHFGRKVTLGSLTEEDMTLGSVRVGRASKTSLDIMSGEDHGRRMALLTGTQGTNVEVDAALSALSEGRQSALDGNPANNPLARPINPKDNVVVISQGAIPGNDRKQTLMVHKLVARGFTVVQSLHDGLQIHHMDKERREAITQRLKKLGKKFRVEEDGSLVITGMPVHAGGHGYEKDCEAWVTLVNADVTAAQHLSDPQAGKRVGELCAKAGCRYMGRVVANFEGIGIKAGDTATTSEISSLGKTLASIIRIEVERQQRKYHGGHIKARQLINDAGEAGLRSDGLRATAREGGIHDRAFAGVDAEHDVRANAARNPGRPEPIAENRMAPPDERPDSGPDFPGKGFRHRFFKRAQQSSVGTGRGGGK